jgi:outer membrane protein assembly factor BamB
MKQKRLTLFVAACMAATFCLCPNLYPANWPQWRGPQGTGIAEERNLPLHWGTNENVLWKVPLPERGNSTPVIWADKVFITQAIESQKRRTLMCFDRSNGKLLWEQGITFREKEPTHETNPNCSASPATDGQRVIAWFGSAGLYCYDFTGKKLWHRDLGRQVHIWGNGTSPVIHGDLCYLNFGPGERSFLIAVDKRTGQTVWQHDEPGGDSGEKKPGQDKAAWIGSWSTPVVADIKGREEVLLSLPKRVAAFDPKSGKEIWTCAGLNPLVYTSVLYSGDIVVSMGGFNGMALALKAEGNGDITSQRLWHHPKTKQRIGSGVIAGEHIYILNDPGVAECVELKTGKVVWENRLKGPATPSDSWSSMVLAGDRIYVVNKGGDSFVLKASPNFELLATNSLFENALASVAPSDGQIFIRTYKHLWCIGKRGM